MSCDLFTLVLINAIICVTKRKRDIGLLARYGSLGRSPCPSSCHSPGSGSGLTLSHFKLVSLLAYLINRCLSASEPSKSTPHTQDYPKFNPDNATTFLKPQICFPLLMKQSYGAVAPLSTTPVVPLSTAVFIPTTAPPLPSLKASFLFL